ncbi:MAG: class I SAM-dependent methyltransferase [Planctomycetota bacterium]
MECVAYDQFLNLERDHWWFVGRRRSYFAILEHFLPNREGLAIADIGCGVGGMLPGLNAFGRPVGVDSDLHSIKICRERGFPNSFVGGADFLPLKTGSHDLVTFFDCLEHLDDDQGALAEVHRVLRPGGTAFFSVPAYQFLFSNNDTVAHHKRRYTRSGLVRKVRQAGLTVEKATYVNVTLFPLILPAVLLLKLKERLFPKPNDTRSNLTHRPGKLANSLLGAVFGGEGRILRYISAPLGHSLVLVARKPKQ